LPEVCLSDTYAQFTDTSKVTPPDFIASWAWNFGDPPSGAANFSTLQNPQHSYSATGPYNVQLIATSNRGCRDTINQVLFVNGSFPQADFNVQNPTTLCANDSVSIVEASTVFPGVITKVEIYWDNVGQPGVFYTDNNPFSGKVYRHLYPVFQAPLTRNFTIRYRAYSGGVCVNDKFKTITVNAAPKVQFNPIPNICLDAPPYQITQASEIGGVPGTGVFSGPGVSPTGLFNPAIAGPGTHTIRYFYTSTAAGCLDSAFQTIHVYAAAIADYSVSTPVCEKQPVTFTSSSTSSEGTLVTWIWDFTDGSPVVNAPSGAPIQHTFGTYGTFNVRLNVITSNGCRSVAKVIPVVVKPIARPKFSFPAISCLPNANVTFTNLSTIPDGTESSFTYLWNFGDPPSGPVNTSTAPNPSHTYVGVGPYSVNLQVTSGSGCIHDTTIIVNTIHPQPLANFTTDKVDVCVGGTITFTSNSNPLDGTISSYNWTMDDGNTKTNASFTYTYALANTYNVSHYIINSYNCKSNVITKTVSINPYPPVNAGPDKFMLEGGQVQLTPTVNASMPVTYSWTPPNYLSNSNMMDPIASPPDDITYTLTVTTDKGCSRSDQVFIKVLKRPDIPNIFSPNGDGIHDTWVIKYLDSYPGCTVDIVNRYGQLVFHSEGYGQPWDGKINGKDAPVGTYYYVVDPKNGRAKITGYVDIIR
jgi:gliding motility-associated-like protein